MMTQRPMSATIALGLLLAFSSTLWADRDDRDERKPAKQEQQREQRVAPVIKRAQEPRREQTKETRGATVQQRERETERVNGREKRPLTDRTRTVVAPAKRVEPRFHPTVAKPGYVLDTRYKHNHYYPPRGHIETVLPPKHRVIIHRNVSYHYHDGVWYRPHGTRFIVVLPPVGLVVPVLPPFYTTIWFGTVPYYYAGGVYYTWQPEYRNYVVTEPPPEQQVRETLNGAVSDSIFIYPKQGQNEQQQAADRYECHRWAVDQTGFDPSLPGGNVTEADHAVKRADYYRAMKACLEARGYSVQ
jgi:hypothetical protein